MSDFVERAEELVEQAHSAQNRDGIGRLKAENRLVGDACEVVAELSNQGDMTESEMNALADQLSDILARYNKTDLKSEFQEHFADEAGEGIPFNELLEDRLEELQTIHSTDAKQGTAWRWHFSDGVKLETETSKDGGRKHYDWHAFKMDYFDSLVAADRGTRIAKPDPELRDPEDWQDWVDELILEHSDAVKHVGPRTEAVQMLRDYVSRNIAYLDMADMRERQGVWVEGEPNPDAEATADGGVSELRVPSSEVKRICDQVGISTRAMQIELDARGVTFDGTNGVSGATYINGQRVAYWSLSASFADPEEVIADPKTPAEQAREEERDQLESERTAVGGVDGETEQPDPEPTPRSRNYENNDEETDDYEPGLREGFGADPDEVSDDD
jgi:hypothetical protein